MIYRPLFKCAGVLQATVFTGMMKCVKKSDIIKHYIKQLEKAAKICRERSQKVKWMFDLKFYQLHFTYFSQNIPFFLLLDQ